MMKTKNNYSIKFSILIYYIVFHFILISCGGNDYMPKPRGYFRIDLPEKKYQEYKNDCPYIFKIPVYAEIKLNEQKLKEPCWINIDFPYFNGKIHISYKKVNNNLAQYIEDSRTFVYKHTIKAESINEQVFQNNEQKVYGILYDISGDAASSVQFFVTDSTKNFLRGALYFNVQPNKDSLEPVINFVREDIIYLMETCKWN